MEHGHLRAIILFITQAITIVQARDDGDLNQNEIMIHATFMD
jgi:hypothetical protein